MTLFYIASGGAIGAVLRYLMTIQAGRLFGSGFPYGTIVVNITGSFLMGVFIGYMAKTLPHSLELRAFAAIGLLGGFTTFSSFSLDVVAMIERGQLGHAAIYATTSMVVAITALFGGLFLMRQF